ncbi:Sec-independent protein translocase TatB [Rothia sp. P7181]|uniref:Sec-independent protein translocase TatB n=1 Tax=unclassified Rothia (in: high G+C Gram-positive bacteria) TaxID=2689056 RepID=UPI003AC2EAC9
MFGINGMEFIVLVILVFVVIGPERMPEYAQKLKEGVKWVRAMAFEAKDDLKEVMGDNPLGDFDWKQYDPRQYDPRTIVREALAEDDEERARLAAEREAENKPPAQNIQRLPQGAYAPFDIEAT